MFFCSEFLNSPRDLQVFQIAHEQSMDGRPDFLILIIKEDIEMESFPEDMQIYLRESMKIFLM